MNKLLVSLALICAFVASSAALKCYFCSYVEEGNVGSDCQGPDVNQDYLKDCGPQETIACLTTVSKGKVSGVNVNAIARTCGSKFIKNGCASNNGVKVCTYICDADGCNTGNGVGNVKFSMLAMITTSAVGLVLSKL